MQRALGAIHRSAAVVVEFTEKGVGLGIEAGYAAALGIPVFVLLRPEAEVSTTLDGISTEVFRYADDESLNMAAARIADKIGRAAGRP
jgi:nucleoside 2-deoxyribosyltransferase